MSTSPIVISGSGLWTPAHTITNEELVNAYNGYADLFNADNADAIASGELKEVPHSSAEFVEKASGIKSRYAYVKDGILVNDGLGLFLTNIVHKEVSMSRYSEWEDYKKRSWLLLPRPW